MPSQNRENINIEVNLPESLNLSNNSSPQSPSICYICHESNNLINNPCGHCTYKVHYNCLLSHLIANWSMQESGYSFRNCSICRRRYPNFVLRDMFHEIEALEQNSPSPIRNTNNNERNDDVNLNYTRRNDALRLIEFIFLELLMKISDFFSPL